MARLLQIGIIATPLFLVMSCSAPASEATPAQVPAEKGDYGVILTARPNPETGEIIVSMQIKQDKFVLKQLRMTAPPHRFRNFAGDGDLSTEGNTVVWGVPPSGGTLSWSATVVHKRSSGGYDRFIGPDWALLRGDDLFPPATTRTTAGAVGNTVLHFKLPAGWSSITQYAGKDDTYRIDNPARRFDRPTGWILLGKIGTRTEKIDGTRITIAAPTGQGIRRMDYLAFLRWIIPESHRITQTLPTRITIFTAGDPMWRGGLSAPSSIFIHSDRPLISENGTSTLAHEIMHLALGKGAQAGSDWIVEGLAEYYGLQLLLRSGTISPARFDKAIGQLDKWGDSTKSLCTSRAKGKVTARATVLFHELNEELVANTGGKHDLDDVIRVLASQREKINTRQLKSIVHKLAGKASKVLNSPLLCES